jgi:hypothetical protein
VGLSIEDPALEESDAEGMAQVYMKIADLH